MRAGRESLMLWFSPENHPKSASCLSAPLMSHTDHFFMQYLSFPSVQCRNAGLSSCLREQLEELVRPQLPSSTKAGKERQGKEHNA